MNFLFWVERRSLLHSELLRMIPIHRNLFSNLFQMALTGESKFHLHSNHRKPIIGLLLVDAGEATHLLGLFQQCNTFKYSPSFSSHFLVLSFKWESVKLIISSTSPMKKITQFFMSSSPVARNWNPPFTLTISTQSKIV